MDCTQPDGSQQRFMAHVPVPSQQDIEQALLKKRKQELLMKYGIEESPSWLYLYNHNFENL